MAINFDALPTSGSQNVLLSGKYLVKIKKHELKDTKHGTGKYFNIMYEAFDDSGKSLGCFFDMLSDSDKNLPRWKLKRFIVAFQIPLRGEFEFKDLGKFMDNKEAYAELKIDQQENYPDKTIVDATAGDIFYPTTQEEESVEAFNAAMADLPFENAEEEEDF